MDEMREAFADLIPLSEGTIPNSTSCFCWWAETDNRMAEHRPDQDVRQDTLQNDQPLFLSNFTAA
jgi:hypothetical protein